MGSSLPLYLSVNRLGIYYFQYRIPKKFQPYLKKTHFRKSLRTRDKQDAMVQSRKLVVLMKDIENGFYSPDTYRRAMDLLKHYEQLKVRSTKKAGDYRDSLEPLDHRLLIQAILKDLAEKDSNSPEFKKRGAELLSIYTSLEEKALDAAEEFVKTLTEKDEYLLRKAIREDKNRADHDENYQRGRSEFCVSVTG